MAEKYLVTGAAGFVGSHLVRKLVKKGEVIAPLKSDTDIWRLKDIKSKNLKKVETDLLDYDSVYQVIKSYKPSYVIHLATRGIYPVQWQDRIGIISGNYAMAANLMEASYQLREDIPIKSFINFGSVFEYGTTQGKLSEDKVEFGDNLNLYSASKKATTILADSYKDDLPVVTLRLFTAYGPTGADTRFIEATILRCLKGEPVKIAPGVVRDFIFVHDIMDAILKTTKTENISGEIINIGSGKKETLESVSILIKKLTKSTSTIEVDSQYIRKKESRCWAEITKAKKLIGWKPKYSLEEGLKLTIKSFLPLL